MKKITITGQPGFIGTHLFNTLNLLKQDFEVVPFKDEYFNDKEKLRSITSDCDVIIHLAAVNRHHDPNEIYDVNLRLVNSLLESLENSPKKPHIIFSSSTQEERDNVYGRSKRDGRARFVEWSRQHKSVFTGLVIPNVFGPFGKPFYNSVISTFCHQVISGDVPRIEIDADLKLIFVGELVQEIISVINSAGDQSAEEYLVPHTSVMKVSDILQKVIGFKSDYFERGIIPQLNSKFEINLFNTFRSYIHPAEFFPVLYKVNEDNRGAFVETMRLNIGGQVSFSTTHPGITRGNHFHTRKIERFAVIQGKAKIQLRKIGTSEIVDLELDGAKPSFVDMPVWYTHNISNIGDTELLTLFWINEFYDPNDPDTFFETV